MRENACTGVLWIHQAPNAVQPHLVWAIARAGLTTPEGLRPGREMWRTRPLDAGADTTRTDRTRGEAGYSDRTRGEAGYGDRTRGEAGYGDVAPKLCAELMFSAPIGAVEKLVSDLERWPELIFEIAVDPVDSTESGGTGGIGARYCHTPELGTFAADTDAIGNIVLNENTIRAIMHRHAGDAQALATAMDEALGGPWDARLEPLRPGTAGFADDEWVITPCDVVHLDSVRDVRAVM